jgi:drug/metabolite transporter (DMT)-like permease
MPNSRKIAVLQLIGAAILWSTGGVLVKFIDWNPMAIAGCRSGIAALVLVFAVGRLHLTWSLPQLGGAVCYAAMVILFVVGNKLTTAANVIFLQYTAPVYVALLSSYFLKEKTTKKDWMILAVVVLGMILLVSDNLSLTGGLGNLCGILSGMSFAAMVILLRKQKEGSAVESVVLGNILTMLVSLPFLFDEGPSLAGWGCLWLLGIFQLGFSYVLYTRALKVVTALEAVLIPYFEPVLNPLWAFLFIHESPGPSAMVGGAIILAAVAVKSVSGESARVSN